MNALGRGVLAWLVALGLVAPLLAHPLSLVWLDLRVEEDRLTGNAEVLLEDLYLFHGLTPDATGRLSREALETAAARHRSNLVADLLFLDAAGRRLDLAITGFRMPELERNGVLLTDLMDHSVHYALSARVEPPLTHLTFQCLPGGSAIPRVVELRIARQGREPKTPVSLPTGVSHTFRFGRGEDEEDPVEDDLGLSSHDIVYSFLYVTPLEVRHEVLIPLHVLEAFQAVERQDPLVLDLAEQEAARATIGAFLASRNPVRIDGDARTPQRVDVEIHGVATRDLSEKSSPSRLPAPGARVGAILTYPVPADPRSVKLTWDLFPPGNARVRATVLADTATESMSLSRARPSCLWERSVDPIPGPSPPPLHPLSSHRESPSPFFLVTALGLSVALSCVSRIPGRIRIVAAATLVASGLLATVMAGRVSPSLARPSKDDATRIARVLLQRMYASLESSGAEELLDALGEGASGGLLRDLFLDLQRSREREDAPSTRIDASSLNLWTTAGGKDPIQPLPGGGFGLLCSWAIEARIEHWGHVHTRTNELTGWLAIEPREGEWRLTALDLTARRRLDEATRVRER